jgi:hypothetical protein
MCGKLACIMLDNQEPITGITGGASSAPVPQFATAEFAGTNSEERCRICGAAIAGEYFRVNNQMACGKCASEARKGQPTDSHAAFVRALLLGAGASLLGLIFYSTFAIVTGWTIGYLALAVGWLVAKAMMKASNGVGGRRYQVAAVLLTYAAISVSAVPIGIASYVKHQSEKSQQNTAQTAQGSNTGQEDTPQKQDGNNKSGSSPLAAIGLLLVYGLASPFLELANPGSGVIGLFILFLGLSIAYRSTAAKPLDVDGPYSTT